MAVFKFINERYDYKSDMWRLIEYCKKQACSVWSPNMLVYSTKVIYDQFLYYKKYYYKNEGDQLLHFVLSFDSGYWERWVSIQTAIQCAKHLCDLFEGFQSVAFLHPKKGQLHVHFLINTVSFVTGNRFHINSKILWDLRKAAAEWLSLENIALLSVSYFDKDGKFRLGKHDGDSLYLNSSLYDKGLYEIK